VARALAIVLLLITAAVVYLFVAKLWWMPPLASLSGGAIDREFTVTLLILAVVFVAAQSGLALFIWRSRNVSVVSHAKGHRGAEIAWTAITGAIFIGLSLAGEHTWADIRSSTVPRTNGVEIEVTGTQFVWYFRYPGGDGKFGLTKAADVDASLGSAAALGLDRSDPDAKDDFVTGTMVVPVDRDVRLRLRAQDVIHSFFVPELRLKQDAVPGLNVEAHFHPTRVGEYEIVCAELCGLGHYRMHGALKVVSAGEYAQWLSQQGGATQ
jgi:cytochrome c oxidase subunit II